MSSLLNIKRKYKKQKYETVPLDTNFSRSTQRMSHATFSLVEGSLSVEASIVVPLFIAALVALLFILSAIQLQIRVQKALYNQAINASGYAYYLNAASIPESAQHLAEIAYVRRAVIDEIGEDYLDSSFVVDGSNGMLPIILSKPESGIYDVAIRYKLRVPFDFLNLSDWVMVSRARCRTWVGTEKGSLSCDEEYVYMTVNGSVYHTHRDCTYLQSQIVQTSMSEIGALRNESGSKYYECLSCGKYESGTDILFVTKYGTRYHKNILCQNLRRYCYMVTREEAEKQYRQCSKCKGRD